MAQSCVCNVGISNLGTPDCIKKMGRPCKLIFTELKGRTGAFNNIPAGQAVDTAYVTAAVGDNTLSQRWYPSPEVKEFLSVKGDPVNQDFDDGTSEFLREGPRSFTGLFKFADSKFVSYLKSVECAKSGFYIVTDQGNIVGYDRDGSGATFPIPVDVMTPTLNFESGDAIQSSTFTLTIPLLVIDSLFSTIYGATADLVGIEGLIQLTSTATVPTTSGFTLTLKGGGQFGYTDPYTGLLLTDLVADNLTQSTSPTITTVAGGVGGVYVVTIGSVATGDVVTLSESSVLTAKGFSFNTVTETIL